MDAVLTYVASLLRAMGLIEWLLLGMLTFALYVLYHAQNENDEFDLRHLVVDPSTNKVILEKFAMFGAFIFSSWGFVALTVKGTLSEWYFIGYMAAWAATRSFTGWVASKKGTPNEPPKTP